MNRRVILPEEFRAAMGSFAAGVTVITTLDERGAPQAVTATAFSSVIPEARRTWSVMSGPHVVRSTAGLKSTSAEGRESSSLRVGKRPKALTKVQEAN